MLTCFCQILGIKWIRIGNLQMSRAVSKVHNFMVQQACPQMTAGDQQGSGGQAVTQRRILESKSNATGQGGSWTILSTRFSSGQSPVRITLVWQSGMLADGRLAYSLMCCCCCYSLCMGGFQAAGSWQGSLSRSALVCNCSKTGRLQRQRRLAAPPAVRAQRGSLVGFASSSHSGPSV